MQLRLWVRGQLEAPPGTRAKAPSPLHLSCVSPSPPLLLTLLLWRHGPWPGALHTGSLGCVHQYEVPRGYSCTAGNNTTFSLVANFPSKPIAESNQIPEFSAESLTHRAETNTPYYWVRGDTWVVISTEGEELQMQVPETIPSWVVVHPVGDAGQPASGSCESVLFPRSLPFLASLLFWEAGSSLKRSFCPTP